MTTEDAMINMKPLSVAMQMLGMDAVKLGFESSVLDNTSLLVYPKSYYRRHNGRGSAGTCHTSARKVDLAADLPPLLLRSFLAHETWHMTQSTAIQEWVGPKVGPNASRCYLGSMCEVESRILEVAAALMFDPTIRPHGYHELHGSIGAKIRSSKNPRYDYLHILEVIFPIAQRYLDGEETGLHALVNEVWDGIEPIWWPKGHSPSWFRWDPLSDPYPGECTVGLGQIACWTESPIGGGLAGWSEGLTMPTIEYETGFSFLTDERARVRVLRPPDHWTQYEIKDPTIVDRGANGHVTQYLLSKHHPHIDHGHFVLRYSHLNKPYLSYYLFYDIETDGGEPC